MRQCRFYKRSPRCISSNVFYRTVYYRMIDSRKERSSKKVLPNFGYLHFGEMFFSEEDAYLLCWDMSTRCDIVYQKHSDSSRTTCRYCLHRFHPFLQPPVRHHRYHRTVQQEDRGLYLGHVLCYICTKLCNSSMDNTISWS